MRNLNYFQNMLLTKNNNISYTNQKKGDESMNTYLIKTFINEGVL